MSQRQLRGAARWLGISLAMLLLACSGGERKTSEDSSKAVEQQAAAPIPTNEAEFLAELVPLPDGAEAIEVRYAVTGPALAGVMTTTIRAGGQRRDQWELRSTLGETELRAAGLTIVTTEQIWTAHEGQPGQLSDNHLAALARAYMRLEPAARAPVVESIRAWHQLLAEQRQRSADAHSELLGVSCLETRVAAQNVCMWEQTGLLLRYEGAAFTIEAIGIERAPKLAADLFTLPPEAAQAERRASGPAQDYDQILAELAAGSYGNVSLLVLGSKGIPSLRLPEAPADDAKTSGQ